MVIESERAASDIWAIQRESENPSERAAWNIQLGVADLFIAVQACKTTDDALRLRAIIEPLQLALDAAESAARIRADELSGASR